MDIHVIFSDKKSVVTSEEYFLSHFRDSTIRSFVYVRIQNLSFFCYVSAPYKLTVRQIRSRCKKLSALFETSAESAASPRSTQGEDF